MTSEPGDVAVIQERIAQIATALRLQSIPMDKHSALALLSFAGMVARMTKVPRSTAVFVTKTFFEDEAGEKTPPP